jgi:hypothetical protein
MLFFSRISPVSIISGHFRTLYNNSTGRASIGEIGILVGLALSLAAAAILLDPKIPTGLSSALLNFFAIVGGFLISALFVVGSYGDAIWTNRANLTEDELGRAKKIQKEIISNVSFGVLLSFAGSLLGVLLVFKVLEKPVVGALAFVLVVFFHTLLTVLKRLEALFIRIT